MTIKYQNYKNYKLPITINLLEYGKLIYNKDNLYIIQVTIRTIALITQFDEFNEVKFFKEGDLVFIYNDHKIDETSFIRSLDNKKYTFKNNELVDTQISIIRANNLLSILSIKTDNTLISKLGIRHFNSRNIIKLRKVRSQNIWKTLTFNINNKVFTKVLFENIFSKFWSQIISEFNGNNHMFILFKIKYNNNEFSTIGNLQRLSQNDKDWYINWIINNMEFKSEYYNETQINSFIISFGFKDGKIEDKNIINPNLNFQDYKNNKLVISFNPLDYGKVLTKTILDNETLYILQNKENLVIKILNSENKNTIEIFKEGDIIIKFEDFKINESTFVRIIDNKKYYFENNEQILFTK